jgi:hypothetical protein
MVGIEVNLTDHPINPASKANAIMTTNNVFRNDSNMQISFLPSPAFR